MLFDGCLPGIGLICTSILSGQTVVFSGGGSVILQGVCIGIEGIFVIKAVGARMVWYMHDLVLNSEALSTSFPSTRVTVVV